MSLLWRFLAGLALLTPGAPEVAGQATSEITRVREGLYVAASRTGNAAMRVTPEGVVLVADELGDARSFQELLADVTDAPIRYVLNTHRHAERPVLRVADGDPGRLLVHRNAWANTRPGAPEARSAVVFATRAVLHVGDAEVRALHLGPGHTDGDVVVHFPDLRVIHAGDLLHEVAPFIDYANGGTSRGWVAALNAMLELDFDLAVPSQGAPMTRDDVVSFRNQMEAVRLRMAELIRAGALRRHVGAGIVSPELSWTLNRRAPFMSRSLSGLYNEIQAELRARGR